MENKPTQVVSSSESVTSVYVVMVLGYWGRGNSVSKAAKECNEAGGRRKEKCLIKVVVGHDFEAKDVEVDSYGAIHYPGHCVCLGVIYPGDHRVNLGQLLKKSTKGKG
jgi:hypothetical protein